MRHTAEGAKGQFAEIFRAGYLLVAAYLLALCFEEGGILCRGEAYASQLEDYLLVEEMIANQAKCWQW